MIVPKSKISRKVLLQIAGVALTIAVLGTIFYAKAEYNYAHQDYRNSNFFFFWLAGRMVWTGQNPYNSVQWLAAHDALGVTWKPNKIFPYPLPLALFMAPLGLLSLPNAYIAWQIATQVFILITVWVLLNHWKQPAQLRLVLPVMIFLLFFGPIYLILNVGSDGALALIFVLIALTLLEKDQAFYAGVVLAMTMLKPPQGITLLILVAAWFLARRDWKAILGLILGGFFLVIVGFMQDPLWISKFLTAGQAVINRTLGVQSNVWAVSYLICRENWTCGLAVGGICAFLGMGFGGFFLWKNHARVTPWEVFNLSIPIAFVSTIYLWSYDQILYVIPIIWIIGNLVEGTKHYFFAFLFLIVLDLVSLTAMALIASTGKDLWSLANSLLVFGATIWLLREKSYNPDNEPQLTLN
jgi:hypothetical protein